MSNIYKSQMDKLGLNENQYSKLTGIPVDVLRKLLKNEKVSENMGLNDFFRKNTVKIHEELESDMDNTLIKSAELNTEDSEILNWYNNEYQKKDLMETTKCKSADEFERKYKIIVKGKRASHWYYGCIVGKNTLHKIAKNVIVEFAKQLKDIIENDNAKQYRDYSFKETKTPKKEVKKTQGQERNLRDSELLKWHYNFNYAEFMEKHDLKVNDISEKLKLAKSTTWALTSKKYYVPSEKILKKVKDFIDSFKNDEVEEGTEVLETQISLEEETIETLDFEEECNIPNPNSFDSNAYVRELIKNTLTEKEKWLIGLFGGHIE